MKTPANYTELPAWADALTELAFTQEAMKTGRARAIAVWNMTPTDIRRAGSTTDYEPVIKDTTADYAANTMVEAAAYAFAIIAECTRVDARKIPFQTGGLAVDPAPNFLSALPVALSVAREYAKWVAKAKTAALVKETGL